MYFTTYDWAALAQLTIPDLLAVSLLENFHCIFRKVPILGKEKQSRELVDFIKFSQNIVQR